ncbi:hypothetical protein [Algoriphagus persicinus]|uniref:hypothetical protein n=1 Tax=Algoriphagus persicinus TaxID=3108754 RepID=UPI002B377949|nr:hypothetical protein [Algoriphagus sp. E1-3-M2]MEB2783473.1 hypothetical protein [Algoriphagus sp. E1-3-M2]
MSLARFHLDQRDPEELSKIVQYWKGLMKSAGPGLRDAGLVSEDDILAMEKDLDSISNEENAVFFYQFVQINATV